MKEGNSWRRSHTGNMSEQDVDDVAFLTGSRRSFHLSHYHIISLTRLEFVPSYKKRSVFIEEIFRARLAVIEVGTRACDIWRVNRRRYGKSSGCLLTKEGFDAGLLSFGCVVGSCFSFGLCWTSSRYNILNQF